MPLCANHRLHNTLSKKALGKAGRQRAIEGLLASYNVLTIDHGRPIVKNLKEILQPKERCSHEGKDT